MIEKLRINSSSVLSGGKSLTFAGLHCSSSEAKVV